MSKARHHRRDARKRGQSASVVTSARRADTGLHAPTAAEVRAVKAKATRPRKRAYRPVRPGEPLEPLNDALTGEPLMPGTHRLPVRDYDAGRQLYRGQPIPTTLHRGGMDGDGSRAARTGAYLGAPPLSRAAERYFAHAIVSAGQRVDGLYAWWLDPYVRGRLVARFSERAVRSAEAFERGMPAREIARVYQVRAALVAKWAASVQRAARGYFRPAGARRERSVPRESVSESAIAMPASA